MFGCTALNNPDLVWNDFERFWKLGASSRRKPGCSSRRRCDKEICWAGSSTKLESGWRNYSQPACYLSYLQEFYNVWQVTEGPGGFEPHGQREIALAKWPRRVINGMWQVCHWHIRNKKRNVLIIARQKYKWNVFNQNKVTTKLSKLNNWSTCTSTLVMSDWLTDDIISAAVISCPTLFAFGLFIDRRADQRSWGDLLEPMQILTASRASLSSAMSRSVARGAMKRIYVATHFFFFHWLETVAQLKHHSARFVSVYIMQSSVGGNDAQFKSTRLSTGNLKFDLHFLSIWIRAFYLLTWQPSIPLVYTQSISREREQRCEVDFNKNQMSNATKVSRLEKSRIGFYIYRDIFIKIK